MSGVPADGSLAVYAAPILTPVLDTILDAEERLHIPPAYRRVGTAAGPAQHDGLDRYRLTVRLDDQANLDDQGVVSYRVLAVTEFGPDLWHAEHLITAHLVDSAFIAHRALDARSSTAPSWRAAASPR